MRSNGAAIAAGVLAAVLILFILAMFSLLPGTGGGRPVASAPPAAEPAPQPAASPAVAPTAPATITKVTPAAAEPATAAEPETEEPTAEAPAAAPGARIDAAPVDPDAPTIEGQVVDAEGAPIAGAQVHGMPAPPGGGRGGRMVFMGGGGPGGGPGGFVGARSGEDGRFVLRGVKTDVAYRVTARGGGMFAPQASVDGARAGDTDVTIVMPRPGSISGRVLERGSGEPIAGATVRPWPGPEGPGGGSRDFSISVSADGEASLGDPTGGVVTDENGAFSISGLEAGRYELRARHEDHAPARSAPIDLAEGADVTDVVIEMDAGAVLAGRVVDERGRPIAGAAVVAASLDAAGRAPFAHRMAAMAAAEMAALPDPEEDEDEGEGARGRLEVGGAMGSRMFAAMGPPLRKTRTGDDGTFLIEHLAPGATSLAVAHRDHAPDDRRITLPDGGLDDLEIELKAGGRIVGRITGPEGEKAVAGKASLTASGPSGTHNARIDDEGGYELVGLAPGQYRLNAHWGGGITAFGGGGMVMVGVAEKSDGGEPSTPRSKSDTAVVRAGEQVRVDFDFSDEASVRLEGVARLKWGEPLANAMIHLQREGEGLSMPLRLQTDERGAFARDGVASGRYRATLGGHFAIGPGGGPSMGVEVEVGEGPTERVEIVFGPGKLILRVVDAATGEPISGLGVTARPAGAKTGGETSLSGVVGIGHTGEDGAATLSVEATAPVTVTVAGRGYVTQTVGPIAVAPQSETRVPDIRLQQGGKVRILARDAEGEVVPDATAVLVGEATPGFAFARPIAGETGVLEVSGLAPGRHTLAVGATGFAPTTIEVTVPAPEAPIEVSLGKGGALEVSVIDGGAQPVAGAKVTLTSLTHASVPTTGGFSFFGGPPSTTDARGLFRRDNLAPGTYRVTVEHDSGAKATGDVEVKAEGEAKLALTAG